MIRIITLRSLGKDGKEACGCQRHTDQQISVLGSENPDLPKPWLQRSAVYFHKNASIRMAENVCFLLWAGAKIEWHLTF
jgi:hypothetical protein